MTIDTGTDPAWSPDGTVLAYVKATDIWVSSPTTGAGDRSISASGTATDADPAWSSDGQTIAFTRTLLAGNADVWRMDAPTDVSTGGGGARGR